MSSSIAIQYSPHPKQKEIHEDPARNKVIVAGRRWGKTKYACAEILKHAIANPQKEGLPVQRSWFIADTYRHAEMIAWKEFLNMCPQDLIVAKRVDKLQVELVNGHIVEFKGSEDPDKLRGVSLVFVVFDEYGQMKAEVWNEIIRPALIDMQGEALFIGTPSRHGSPHFEELFNLGTQGLAEFKSWLCYTKDNPYIDPKEVEKSRATMSPDAFKREFEADFSSTAGLIYDNFKHITHVIPNYEPAIDDIIVGSVDPGLHNPTGALLVAWDKEGVGRIFKEYYVKGKLATENALAIKKIAAPYKVMYWVIDRSAEKRDPASGLTVAGKYREVLRPQPVVSAPNDPGSVWAGIDEVKKLFHIDPSIGRPKLVVTAQCHNFLWEIARYIAHEHKWHVDVNPAEKPRKLHDHLCDAIRNMIMTRPWLRRNLHALIRRDVQGGYY